MCSQSNVKKPNNLPLPPQKSTKNKPWSPLSYEASGILSWDSQRAVGGGRRGRRAWVCLCSLKRLFNKHVKQTERQEGKGERRGPQNALAAHTGMKHHCQPVGKGSVLNSSLDLRSWLAWTRSDTLQLGSFNEFTLPNSRGGTVFLINTVETKLLLNFKSAFCLCFIALRQNVFQAPKRLQEGPAPLNQVVTPSQLSPYLISCVQLAVTQCPLFNLHW